MYDKLKAIAAAVVGLASTWAMNKFGFEMSIELQATIIGAVMGLVVYIVPNIKPAAPAA